MEVLSGSVNEWIHLENAWKNEDAGILENAQKPLHIPEIINVVNEQNEAVNS